MVKKWNKHERGSLMTKTLELLNSASYTHLEVFSHTGIKPDWLTRFINGKINDPGVNRVQALHEFLTGRDLEV